MIQTTESATTGDLGSLELRTDLEEIFVYEYV